ncbi:MAG: phosphotransferase family protein [Gemmatimonadales bacterium]
MSVVALDPFGAGSDPQMPVLTGALDPAVVERCLRPCLPGLLAVGAIRVVRYKPGRRCLIEYDVEMARPERAAEALTLVAKVRPRGADMHTFRLMQALWHRGFDAESRDGISVPAPVAAVPELGLWLQRKVQGTSATALLLERSGVELAARLGEAVHKLHTAGVPTRRRHTLADELRILQERLGAVARARPEWAARVERLLRACERVSARLSGQRRCGIHRDFYADHAVLDGQRVYLLDFDLYCEGDAAVDVGNCIAHITEHSLRTCGHPLALADREAALEERFVELAGPGARAAVLVYALLTLARHISLSTQFAERRPFTTALLELCEERLDLSSGGRAATATRLSPRAGANA